MHQAVQILPEVAAALADGAAVVALESTIISHGLPYPDNVQTAHDVEQTVRRHGAVPATIGIVQGRIQVGLSQEQLEHFGRSKGIGKVSRRDLPIYTALRRDGATTVAATMICARLAGISVFVTGGIGGVHRDGQVTMDVSADLLELARTNVVVVCAGAKAILDLPRTLEVLETHGVPVIGYQCDHFPSFFCQSSGLPVDIRIDDPAEVAHCMNDKWTLGLDGGLVVATPVPASHALDPVETDAAISSALQRAAQLNIRGKAITPFLLQAVRDLTGGRSLQANVALVQNNAKVGAQIAKAFASIHQTR